MLKRQGIVLTLQCDMSHECSGEVTHLDNKGFVYCESHGVRRRSAGTPCRKLRPSEINKLRAGKQITRY